MPHRAAVVATRSYKTATVFGGLFNISWVFALIWAIWGMTPLLAAAFLLYATYDMTDRYRKQTARACQVRSDLAMQRRPLAA